MMPNDDRDDARPLEQDPAAWIDLFASGDVPARKRARVRALLIRDRAHYEEVRQARECQGILADYFEHLRPAGVPLADRVLQELGDEVPAPASAAAARLVDASERREHRRVLLAVATVAALALLAGGAVYLRMQLLERRVLGRVAAVEGQVRMLESGGLPTSLVSGDDVRDGDVLETAAGSRMRMRLASGASLDLEGGARAELRLRGGALHVDLARGRLTVRAVPGEPLVVGTPRGSIATRGERSEIMVGAPSGDGDRDVRLEVREGRVSFMPSRDSATEEPRPAAREIEAGSYRLDAGGATRVGDRRTADAPVREVRDGGRGAGASAPVRRPESTPAPATRFEVRPDASGIGLAIEHAVDDLAELAQSPDARLRARDVIAAGRRVFARRAAIEGAIASLHERTHGPILDRVNAVWRKRRRLDSRSTAIEGDLLEAGSTLGGIAAELRLCEALLVDLVTGRKIRSFALLDALDRGEDPLRQAPVLVFGLAYAMDPSVHERFVDLLRRAEDDSDRRFLRGVLALRLFRDASSARSARALDELREYRRERPDIVDPRFLGMVLPRFGSREDAAKELLAETLRSKDASSIPSGARSFLRHAVANRGWSVPESLPPFLRDPEARDAALRALGAIAAGAGTLEVARRDEEPRTPARLEPMRFLPTKRDRLRLAWIAGRLSRDPFATNPFAHAMDGEIEHVWLGGRVGDAWDLRTFPSAVSSRRSPESARERMRSIADRFLGPFGPRAARTLVDGAVLAPSSASAPPDEVFEAWKPRGDAGPIDAPVLRAEVLRAAFTPREMWRHRGWFELFF